MDHEQTTNADERRIPTSKEPTHRHAVRVACDRHTTPPACTPTRHSQPLGVCSRPGIEASGNGVDVQGPRHVGPTEILHPSPLGPTPRGENRQDLHETESMWSHTSSVSRRGFTRIYEFLTGLVKDKSGSTTEATRVPNQGTLDPDCRHFSPGGGGCRPAPLASHRRGDGTVYYLFSPPACPPTLRVHATSAIQPGS
jgi:hypothetical protein